MWSHGNFYWNELMTRDAEAAKQFYGATLGWLFEVMPLAFGSYWIAKVGDAPVAGILEMTGPDFDGLSPGWFAYIAVDDVDKRVKKLLKAGGTVLREPFDVADVGRLAIVLDNSGVRFGFITPKSSES